MARCTVKVLIVTDGNLNFGEGDFGLSTFVRVLKNDAPNRVRFDLTLARIRNESDAEMLDAEPGIARRIKLFRFDDASHFAPEMKTRCGFSGSRRAMQGWRGAGRFSPPLKSTLSTPTCNAAAGCSPLAIMGSSGKRSAAAFRACGHAALGRFPEQQQRNERSQHDRAAPERHATRWGTTREASSATRATTSRSALDLVLYSTVLGVLRAARYPHPLLCGRTGRIDVLPDHPHEGECRVPPDVTSRFGGADEYPRRRRRHANRARGHRPEPRASGEQRQGQQAATVAHTFGAISAYDGHRAGGKGRVVVRRHLAPLRQREPDRSLEGGIFDELVQFPDEDPSKHTVS